METPLFSFTRDTHKKIHYDTILIAPYSKSRTTTLKYRKTDMDKTVLITGASGFIGTYLTALLVQDKIDILATSRTYPPHPPVTHKVIEIGKMNGDTDWSTILPGREIIIHLAARVHIMDEKSLDSLASFRSVNVDGTLNLARQAAKNGVKRFLFLSSIKVNGEKTDTIPFHPLTPPAPEDPYGISKLEAEEGLLQIAKETDLEVVIIRPPLVYGKEAGGNFARLRRLATLGIPLPLGSIHNKRSLVGIDNLCSLIKICLDHPNATKAPLLVSDNQDVSTPDLIRLLAASADKSIRLLPFPFPLLKLFATLCGRGPEIKRLSENLQVDCSDTIRLLDWQPPLSLEQGIKQSFG